MINVVAPPGCYGTYIARCLHHYTLPAANHHLDFDQEGSSHAFRMIDDRVKKTSVFHCPLPSDLVLDARATIVITGDQRHYLDYYNNQLYKQSHGSFISYLVDVHGLTNIQQHLLQGWNYSKTFNSETPIWIVREYCSFWIADALAMTFSSKMYLSTPHIQSFCCQSMWNGSMWQLINQLATALSETVYASESVVQQNHQTFLQCQKYHGIQLQCDQFVVDTINGIESDSPCGSILDEAYVQHILRKKGYEIQCQGLDHFPKNSNQLAKIIYETSNHSNSRRSQYQD